MALEDAFVGLVGHSPVVQAFVGGAVIAGLNLLGAVLILVYRNPTQRLLDGALGFAAGGLLFAFSDGLPPKPASGATARPRRGTTLGAVVRLSLDGSLG